ncbi:MAG: hypothetical protein ACO2ZD_01935, partial [Pseudomonadales bacterium]
RVATIENRITRLNEKLSDIEANLAQPIHYEDPRSESLQSLLRDQASLRDQITALEEEWLELETERDNLT